MPRPTKEELLFRSELRKIHWKLAPALILFVFVLGYLATGARFYFSAILIGYSASLLVSELIVSRRRGASGFWHCLAVVVTIGITSSWPYVFLTEGHRRPILEQAVIEEVVASKVHSYSGYEPSETKCERPDVSCTVTAAKTGTAYWRYSFNTRVDGKPCPEFGVLVRWRVYECKSGTRDVSEAQWRKLDVGDVLKLVELK